MSSKKKAKANKEEKVWTLVTPEEVGVIVEEEEKEADTPSGYVAKQGIFEFTVLEFNFKLPGEEDYVPERDPLMIGFRYGNKTPPSWLPFSTPLTDVTAYDFLTDPRTGLRPGQKIAPHGSANTHLTAGITDWTDLPPLFIWKKGRWLSDLIYDDEFNMKDLPVWLETRVSKAMEEKPVSGVHKDIFTFFVTSGEGTTGNNIYRIFELPPDVSGNTHPHHPLMWKESLKKSHSTNSNAHKGESWRPECGPQPSSTGGWTGAYKQSETPTKTVVSTAAPKIPQGVRLRCPECGHWYSYTDLVTHSTICGDPEKEDWAMMCHGDCGCTTLDEACQPKPGFPRPKKKEEVKELAVVAAGNGAGGGDGVPAAVPQ